MSILCKTFVDLIFPPLCLHCKEKCSTKFFCPDCWELCAPPDPLGRCRHCFEEVEKKGMCAQCRREPELPIARAFVFERQAPILSYREAAAESMAGFAVNQWIQLEWETPDTVVPMPDGRSRGIGKIFAQWLGFRFCNTVVSGDDFFELRDEDLGDVILIFDAGNSLSDLKKAIFALSEAFPKRMVLLSLSHFSDF